MAEISQNVNIEMLEKLPDGTYKRKYPKTRSDTGVTFDEHLAENVSQAHEPILQGYSETIQSSNGIGVVNLDISNGNVFNATLTGNTDFTLSPTDNNANSLTLILSQGATVYTVTFPASVKWQGGEIPDLSEANKTYILTFVTVDSGANWFGFMAGEFNAS